MRPYIDYLATRLNNMDNTTERKVSQTGKCFLLFHANVDDKFLDKTS